MQKKSIAFHNSYLYRVKYNESNSHFFCYHIAQRGQISCIQQTYKKTRLKVVCASEGGRNTKTDAFAEL